MKKLCAILIARFALVICQPIISPHSSEAAAQIPLPSGHFSFAGQASVAFCVDPTTIALEPCSTSGAALLADSGLDNGSAALDSSGNACATITHTDSFLPIASSSSISPSIVAAANTSHPLVSLIHSVFTVDDYNQATGIGHNSVTIYSGGTCSGASFNSSGAMQINSAKNQFVVSNGGNRIDFVVTSFGNPDVGSFSDSGTELRQTGQNEQ